MIFYKQKKKITKEEYFIEKKSNNLNLEPENETDALVGLGPFSIQNFIKMAKDEFSLEEGNWFRSTTFLMSLEYMLERNESLIKDKSLRVYNSIDNVIFLDKLLGLLYKPSCISKLGKLKNISSGKEDKLEEGGQQIKNQSGTKDNSEDIAQTKNDFENITKIEEGIIKETKSINEDIKESQLIQKFISPPSEVTLDPQNLDFWEFHDQTFESLLEWLINLKSEPIRPVLMSLNTMLGLSEIDLSIRSFIEKMLRLSSFVGMLGGKEYKAFYFIGYDDHFFYYLDPHYVQKAHESGYQDEEYIKNYFRKKIFKTRFKDISPSLSFCFLLETNKGIQIFFFLI